MQNTVVVTFGNMRQAHLTENWVYHLQRVGVGGLLVGMMNMSPEQPRYRALAASLRGLGVGVYCVNSPQVRRQPQGGRWFHVLPLLRTGARVLLSDSDVVWMRDPRPYLRRLEELHPKLDFTVSSDAQGGTDGRRLGNAVRRVPGSQWSRRAGGGRVAGRGGGRGRRRGMAAEGDGGVVEGGFEAAADGNDLDIEGFGHCWASMNIGIMHFPPGARPGTLASMEQAVQHLSEENNLGRVDQGPINYRWKHGAGKWRWQHQLYSVPDRSGRRMCGLLNGTSVGVVLPSAQFCNTLTHSVLRLYQALDPPVQVAYGAGTPQGAQAHTQNAPLPLTLTSELSMPPFFTASLLAALDLLLLLSFHSRSRCTRRGCASSARSTSSCVCARKASGETGRRGTAGCAVPAGRWWVAWMTAQASSARAIRPTATLPINRGCQMRSFERL